MSTLQENIWEHISERALSEPLRGKFYRLKEWPSFGFCKYSPDFIILSANLSKGFLNKTDLLRLVHNNEMIVNHFLNAANQLEILDVVDQNPEETGASNAVFDQLTTKLKKLFNADQNN